MRHHGIERGGGVGEGDSSRLHHKRKAGTFMYKVHICDQILTDENNNYNQYLTEWVKSAPFKCMGGLPFALFN